MKSKEEYLKEAAKRLLPIGSRCIITYVKSEDFYKQGIIIQHFGKEHGFIWDYVIRLDDDSIVYYDKPLVDPVSETCKSCGGTGIIKT